MAKRYTDTNKYKKPFIRSLEAPYKLLWDYLYHECDHAGVWIVDFDIAQIYIGKDAPVDKDDALKFFNSTEIRIVEFDGGARWFIPSFIDFQYGELNPLNRVHKSVISILEEKNLLNVNKPLRSPLQGSKDKEKDKDKVKDKEKDKEKEKEKGPKKLSKVSLSDYPMHSEMFINAWKEWLTYKSGKSGRIEPYKTEQTERAALNKLARYAQEAQITPDDKAAALIVEQGISNEWEGLHPLKIESNGTTKNRRQSGAKLNLSPDEVAHIVNS